MEAVPNEVKQFVAALVKLAPGVRADLEPGGVKAGNWWIDLRGARRLTVEWRPGQGFGLSSGSVEGYGEGPAEIFQTPERAARRVGQLLAPAAGTVPTGLRMLRELFNLTQEQIAQRLNRKQAAISRLESREDSKIETIKEYVESMGGRVEVRAIFPDSRLPIYSLDEVIQSIPKNHGSSKPSRVARA